MTIEQAVERFRSAADRKAELAEPAALDHRLHHEMSKAYTALVGYGEAGRAAFHPLLADPSPHVRGWVGAQLLSEGDEAALPVVEALAAEPGIRGFTARRVLEEYYCGRLGAPFRVM